MIIKNRSGPSSLRYCILNIYVINTCNGQSSHEFSNFQFECYDFNTTSLENVSNVQKLIDWELYFKDHNFIYDYYFLSKTNLIKHDKPFWK